ncbi:hypothetical protein FBQ99_06780 [Chloroflexi bacterium CFX2]|nr:hypothetical protein [Chloroflexi bacterium CFX2]
MKPINKRLLSAWFLGVPLSYFVVGYLENFYQSAFEIFLLALPVHALAGLFVHHLSGRILRAFRSDPTNAALSAVVYAAVFLFIPAAYSMAKPFPKLFDANAFHLPAGQWLSFSAALTLALPLTFWLFSLAQQRGWKETRFFKFVDENLDGLVIALLFSAVYLIFASIFNRPSYDADDIFFDADGNLYRWRFATEKYRDYYWRPAHPFILIIIRPLVGILAFLFKGDALFAAFTLNALTGALCVFLVWYFVRNSAGNPLYALLIAGLFGASSTQLAFGSIIESYIYLAAVALVFLVLLLKDKPLYMQVIAGLIAFGITISNVGQTFIAHFFVKRNLRQIIVYGLIVGALVVPLSLLNNFIYPESQPYFWDIATLEGEGHNQFPPTLQRAEYLARVIVLHSFVAPEPLVIRDGWPFPKVWMFRASIKKDPMLLANYETPLGDGLALAWVGLMALGGALFLKNLFKQDNGYFLAFLFTVLFYFALHLQYGKDVFLYAANWTYAITLFLALAWRELAEKRWFQILLLVFVLFLLVNNSQMYRTMMEISAPSVPFPVWR